MREAVEENTGEKFRFIEKLNVYAEFVPGAVFKSWSSRLQNLL
jgi:hypothetical protein